MIGSTTADQITPHIFGLNGPFCRTAIFTS